jgi:hypothetical protein
MSDLTDLNLPISETLALQAKQSPNAPMYLFLNDRDEEVTVSYKAFEAAFRLSANKLSSGLKPDETVGVIGVTDSLVYQTVVVGLCSAKAVVCSMQPISSR